MSDSHYIQSSHSFESGNVHNTQTGKHRSQMLLVCVKIVAFQIFGCLSCLTIPTNELPFQGFLLSALLNPPPTSAANSAGAKKSDKQLVLVVD